MTMQCECVDGQRVGQQIEVLALVADGVCASEEEGVVEGPVDALGVVASTVEPCEVRVAWGDGSDVLGAVELASGVVVGGVEPDGDGPAAQLVGQLATADRLSSRWGDATSSRGLGGSCRRRPNRRPSPPVKKESLACPSTPRTIAILTLATAIGVLGACSDDDDAGSSTTSSSDTTAPTDTTGGDDGEGALDGAAQVTISSDVLDATYDVQSCDNPSESDLELSAEDAGTGIALSVSVQDGSGTIHIEGGDEQDGILLDGTVDSLEVGDAGDIVASGSFDTGESFELSGSCAGA